MTALLRGVVALLLALVVVLAAAQQVGSDGPGWLELTRYLPYPVLLAPAALAVLLSLALGGRWLVASVASVALVAVVVMGFVWHSPQAPDPAGGVRLMTWNAKVEQAQQRPGGLAALADEVRRHAPDILVMQDANGLVAPRRGASPEPLFDFSEVYAAGQFVIASRFPLRDCALRQATAAVPPLPYARCTVSVQGVDMNVVTAHLESPRQGLDAARREGLEGTPEWRRNHAERLMQARALASELAASPRPLIVAGDLNAPQSSAVVGSLLALGLRDAFASAGRGWGYTYGHALRPGFSFLRIDHILVGPPWQVADSVVGGSEASPHRPVIADLVRSTAGDRATTRQTSKKTVSSSP